MNRQKRIIEQLEGIINSNAGRLFLTEGAIEDNKYIIECIEKQIPRKPIWRWDGNETIIECPNCGKYPFDMSEYEWARQFCGNCGQAILWESDNE